MILTSFSDFNTPLEEYPKSLKGKRLHQWIIKNLKHRVRISCWEIAADQRMCRTLMYLVSIKRISLTGEDLNYPYVKVEVL